MNENQYENFKNGVKKDINNTVSSLFIIGGLTFLVILIFAIIVAIKNSNLHDGLKAIIIIGLLLLLGIITFSNKARNYILCGWLILLAAIIILPIFALSFYCFYIAFTCK